MSIKIYIKEGCGNNRKQHFGNVSYWISLEILERTFNEHDFSPMQLQWMI